MPSDEYHEWRRRHTDPISSDMGLHNARTKKAKLITLINSHPYFAGEFTDDDLTEALEAYTGARQQRNVVARSRCSIEDEGIIERLPQVQGEVLRFVRTNRGRLF